MATRISSTHSVFWISGQSSDTTQDWVDRASCKIKPDFTVELGNNITQLRDWLMDPANGRWVLIVDDLCYQSGLQKLVPSPVSWGIILITCRQSNANLHFDSTNVCMPSLTPEEALRLFLTSSNLISGTNPEPSRADPMLPLRKITSGLCDSPAAIVFAASCTTSKNPASVANYLSMLEEEDSISGGPWNSKTMQWASIMFGELKLAERSVLTQLYLFSPNKYTEEFIELMLSSSRFRYVNGHFLQRQPFWSALEQLTRRGCLQRDRDPRTQGHSMPRLMQEVLEQKLASDRDNFGTAAGIAKIILCDVFKGIDLRNMSEFQAVMSTLSPHHRALSHKHMGRLERSDLEIEGLTGAIFLHYIMKATGQGMQRSLRQSWRRWMGQNGYELSGSSAMTTDDDGIEFVDNDSIPSWLYDRSASNGSLSNNTRGQSSFTSSLKEILWKSLRDSITIGIIGSGWHGIRDEIFDFVRENRNSRSDTEVAAIIDYIDKGACAGLIQIVKKYVHGDVFKEKMMVKTGADVIHDLSRLLDQVLDDGTMDLEDTAITDGVQGALEFLMAFTFREISRSFDAMLVPLKSFLNTLIESPLKGSSPDSFQSIVSFTVETMSESYVQSFALSAGRAFWDVLSSAQTWLAASIVNHINFALLTSSADPESHGPVHSPGDRFTTLNNRSMELVREGVIASHVRSTPGWRLSMRKATYWCLLAEQATRSLPIDVAGRYKYRNQERWEEVCILLEMTEAVWPLSA